MTKDELIAALEKAEGPRWELDKAIFAHIYGWSYPLRGSAISEFCEVGQEYTASIDAALTLVPEGAFWNVLTDGERPAVFFQAAVATHAMADAGRGLEWHEAATPALALCIAALRART